MQVLKDRNAKVKVSKYNQNLNCNEITYFKYPIIHKLNNVGIKLILQYN